MRSSLWSKNTKTRLSSLQSTSQGRTAKKNTTKVSSISRTQTMIIFSSGFSRTRNWDFQWPFKRLSIQLYAYLYLASWWWQEYLGQSDQPCCGTLYWWFQEGDYYQPSRVDTVTNCEVLGWGGYRQISLSHNCDQFSDQWGKFCDKCTNNSGFIGWRESMMIECLRNMLLKFYKNNILKLQSDQNKP